MLLRNRGRCALALALALTSGCYEEVELASVDVWHDPGALTGETALPAVGSVLETYEKGNAGRAMAAVGDVDGDGFDDILLGDRDYWLPKADVESILLEPCAEAPCHPQRPGAAHLIYGRAEGLPPSSTIGDSDAVFEGEESEDLAGDQVSQAGDVNGDGFADFIVVAPRDDWFPNEGEADWPAGPPQIWRRDIPSKAYLFYGSATRFSGAVGIGTASTRFEVAERHRVVKQALGIGDINGDGFGEVAVVVASIPNYPEDIETTGATAHVYFGRKEGLPAALTPEEADLVIEPDVLAEPMLQIALDLAVEPVGDINADGFADMAIGQYLTEKSETGPDLVYTPEVFFLLGHEDIPTGTVSMSDVTQVRIGSEDPNLLGTTVSGVGDLNDDGYDDVAISDAFRWRNIPEEFLESKGHLFIFMGGDGFQSSGDTAPLALDVAEADTVIGYDMRHRSDTLSFAGANDVDGDRFDDLLIGRSSYDDELGMAAMFYGGVTFGGDAFDLSQADAVLTGEVVGVDENEEHNDAVTIRDMAGEIVAGAGDFNGDGFGDLLIGAPSTRWQLAGGTGRVYLVPGGPRH